MRTNARSPITGATNSKIHFVLAKGGLAVYLANVKLEQCPCESD
jgi:hypothetical protein